MTPNAAPKLLPDNRALAGGTDLPAPACPRCGGPTYYRTGYHQPKPHSPFFSCINFPRCSGAVSYEKAGRDLYDVDPDPDDMDSIYDAFLYDVGDRE